MEGGLAVLVIVIVVFLIVAGVAEAVAVLFRYFSLGERCGYYVKQLMQSLHTGS